MRRPSTPRSLGPRHSSNDKRKLMPAPSQDLIRELVDAVVYEGSSKHKREPHRYGLTPFQGRRGDATLCDVHADFQPEHMAMIPQLIRRGIRAGLIGMGSRTIWTVANDGWIFEARLTNAETSTYHGYPVRPEEAIADVVFRRYSGWAVAHGAQQDRHAMVFCRDKYGLR